LSLNGLRTQAGGRSDPQQHVAGLLGRRGPGASKTEFEAHQNQRVVFGGLPVTVARDRDRDRESLSAAKARGEPIDLAQAHAARRLDQLDTTPPTRPHLHRGTTTPFALALGLLLGFAAARLTRPGHQRREYP
jgi:hypothetical protein